MSYDDNNVFARILRGEIPCNKVFENEFVLAFRDITPKAPVHILVIPKGQYKNATDFGVSASSTEHSAFFNAIAHIIEQENLAEDGYRLIANTGINGGQEVDHFHMHILGGEPIGALRG